ARRLGVPPITRRAWHGRCASSATRATLQRVVSVAPRSKVPMPPRRPPVPAALIHRPVGPRCHGGASSLLRLASAVLPQRAVAARASGWRELVDDGAASVEHIVRRPLIEPGATIWY